MTRRAQWRISAWKNALVSPTAALDTAATDNYAKLNYDNYQGSGKGVDMALLIPDALFITSAANPVVYLYSRFGENFKTKTVIVILLSFRI